ncbi:MAG TPA: hypothetical protein DCS66_10950 [Flavobacteriaceae bacterium]|nr:hypothetical protein [Flavobacteriaceae bacterium]HAT65102.1 hypothetical protein [Flavobacteriaceae bacterium]
MEIIETNITERTVKYIEFDTSINCIKLLPLDNWCLIIIADDKNQIFFEEIIGQSIDRKVGYILSVGEQYDFIHNLADEIIGVRACEIEDNFLPEHVIMTVGEKDFENGIWFGLFLTMNNETDINETIILDFTKRSRNLIIELIKKIENGYLPPDDIPQNSFKSFLKQIKTKFSF